MTSKRLSHISNLAACKKRKDFLTYWFPSGTG